MNFMKSFSEHDLSQDPTHNACFNTNAIACAGMPYEWRKEKSLQNNGGCGGGGGGGEWGEYSFRTATHQ